MRSGAILFFSCGIVLMPLMAHAQCVEFEDPAELFKLSDAVFVAPSWRLNQPAPKARM
jgi:hypothetical protein